MPSLPLTFACCRYDRMEAIREGIVTVEGVDLTCITLKSGRDVFDRMVGGQEFDVAELSASEFISLQGTGDSPFVALPVFPSRVFRHGYIFVNTRAGIRIAKDLEGKRVGLPLYTQTAALWARGHLAHQFGVDLEPSGGCRARWKRRARTASRMRRRCCGRSAIEQNTSGELARRAAGARRDRCPDRLAQAGDVRPRSGRGAAVSQLPRA